MSKLVNIAGQKSETVGTGDLILDDAVTGYVTFEDAGVKDGERIGYVIWDAFGPEGPSKREVGYGVYYFDSTGVGTLVRDTVLTSTESDAVSPIDCSGLQQVFVTATAEDMRSAHVSAVPPKNLYNGQLWWDITDGTLYVYYIDGDSSQWVPATPQSIAEFDTGKAIAMAMIFG